VAYKKTLVMKTALLLFLTFLLVVGCNSTKKTILKNNTNQEKQEYVRIANDSLEYEIIIIDIGFEAYLHSIAKPATFYSQSYYEIKNRLYVTEWNSRVQNPLRYNSSIYENRIDYDFNTDYGLDVNYKLYNYFKFVAYKYKEKLF